jgi:hypothetical protein
MPGQGVISAHVQPQAKFGGRPASPEARSKTTDNRSFLRASVLVVGSPSRYSAWPITPGATRFSQS